MKIITYKGAVQTHECDSNQHMNVQYYINKFELAGRQFGLSMGMRNDYLQQESLGVVVLEQHIKYLKEVFEDDLIHIKSELEGFTSKVFSVKHVMYNSETEEVVADMKIKLVLLDKEKRKAAIIPDIIRKQMKQIVSAE